MLVRKLPRRSLFYPSRRGGSSDNNPWFDDDPWRPLTQRVWDHAKPFLDDESLPQQPAPFGLDDAQVPAWRHRVAGWKLFYPSRRGGSSDNNTPIAPLGVDDDPWQPQGQRLWKFARAFSDDEVYVVNVEEDYLWIATQSFWEPPLVAATDDEIRPTQNQIGVDDEAIWCGAQSGTWKSSAPFIQEDIFFFPKRKPTGRKLLLGVGF